MWDDLDMCGYAVRPFLCMFSRVYIIPATVSLVTGTAVAVEASHLTVGQSCLVFLHREYMEFLLQQCMGFSPVTFSIQVGVA